MASHDCPSHPCPICESQRELRVGSHNFTPTPLSAEDVRRILREEIEKYVKGKTR